jgi:transcriptional regulator with XRE-family HTH domain
MKKVVVGYKYDNTRLKLAWSKRRDLTFAQAEEKTKITRNTLSRCLREGSNDEPSLPVLLKMCVLLQVPLSACLKPIYQED